MARRARKKQQARERILAVCERLFRTRGFDATTVDEIAEQADISRQTFFNYFAGKEAALTEVGLRWLEAGAGPVRAEVGQAPSDARIVDLMRAGLRRQLRAIESDREFARLVFTRSGAIFPQGPAPGSPDDKPRLERVRDLLALNVPLVRAAQQRGELRSDVPASQIAEIIVGAILFGIRLAVTDYWQDAQDLESRLCLTLDLILEGLETGRPTNIPHAE